MDTNNDRPIDFDTWAMMAKERPDDFEVMRQAALEAFFARVPTDHRDRLRRLQWRVDQERRLARTPMAACVRISRMMWRSLLGEGGLRDKLNGLEGNLLDPRPSTETGSTGAISRTSNVVGFRRA